jgi:hypothetical protein
MFHEEMGGGVTIVCNRCNVNGVKIVGCSTYFSDSLCIEITILMNCSKCNYYFVVYASNNNEGYVHISENKHWES